MVNETAGGISDGGLAPCCFPFDAVSLLKATTESNELGSKNLSLKFSIKKPSKFKTEYCCPGSGQECSFRVGLGSC